MPDWKIWREEDLVEGRSGGRMIWRKEAGR
jgi:hypothetical protein